MADKKLKVTLVKSANGIVPKNKKIIEALGLHKVNSSNILPDNDATRGMLRRVDYLVKVEEA
ncbi:MAG: 50S ribosomal protein L30 [Lachnospiraceae bacterium]|nr:50S ribosomal protein L30 [Lachnospiraceae bacterium]